jgi:hypothetical protein
MKQFLNSISHKLIPYTLSVIIKYLQAIQSFYNYTKRPSNRFNGINFAALNKENGERKVLNPKTRHLLSWILVLITLPFCLSFVIILSAVVIFMGLSLKCMEWIMPKQKRSRLNKFTVEFGRNMRPWSFFKSKRIYG